MIRKFLCVAAATLVVTACAWPPPGLQVRDDYMGRAWLERDIIIQPPPRTATGEALAPGTAPLPGVPVSPGPIPRDAFGNPVLP